MIHIVHLIPTLTPGGALRSLAACARECSRLEAFRHTAVGLSPCPSSDQGRAVLQEDGVESLEAPNRDVLNGLLAGADLVVVHFWNDPGLDALLREDLPPMRLVVHCHVNGLHPPQVITPALVALADRLLLTSPVSESVPALAALDPDRRRRTVRVIAEAADFARLEGCAPRSHPGFVVTYLGTVDFLKMHPDFMAMSAGIRLPQVRFVIRGHGGDHDALARQARSLGLEERCDIGGPVNDVRALFEETDVLGYPLCPQTYATSELVLREAAFAGVPAVVLPYGGAARTVIHDFTGYVVHDAAEYATAIESLFYHPEERARLGRNAREYARQLFGAERIAGQTVPVYRELLAEPKRTRPALGAATGPEVATEALLTDTGCLGAWRFVASLGDTAPHFLDSLTADAPETALAADETIARESPVVVRNGLFPYRDAYPDDGVLLYWTALTQGERGDTEAALTGCLQAVRRGCDHWRAFWAIARLAEALGQTELAREALDRVLAAAPGLTRAREMFDRLLAAPDRPEPSLDDQRLRRHLLTQAGDLARAEEQARAVLAQNADAGDFEAFYLLGVEWHKRGQCDRARAIYDRLLADGRTPVHLQAWSRFKLGELLLDDGREEDARQALALALALKPDLAKARLLLVPAGETLRVRLGDAADDAAISVPMAPLDAGLWAYYFTRRRPDQISLELPAGAGLLEWTRLGRLLADYLAPGGQARLKGAADEAISATLGRFGLTSIRSDDGVLLLRAPDPVASRF